MIKKHIVKENLLVKDKKGNLKRVEFFSGDANYSAEVRYKVLNHSQPWRIGQIYKTSLKKFAEFIHGIYVEGDKFKQDDLVEYEGKCFRVVENNGAEGILQPIGHDFNIKQYWRHGGGARFVKVGSVLTTP